MSNIERLLNAFPEGLYVRREEAVKRDEHSEEILSVYYSTASEEAKEAFRTALKEHLFSQLEKCKVGESVSYNYFVGKIRATNKRDITLVSSINQNLTEVMSKLPELKEGETYVFPNHTSVSVKVVGATQQDLVTSFEEVSGWLWDRMQ